jgi:hypothetical protein
VSLPRNHSRVSYQNAVSDKNFKILHDHIHQELCEFDRPLLVKTWHYNLPLDCAIVKFWTKLGTLITLTRILDTGGSVFGGFTPLQWESPLSEKWKCDDSLKGFLFTLKNPHNTRATKFAIYCDSSRAPIFSGIYGYENCSFSRLGLAHTSDTGLDERSSSWVQGISM